MPYRFRRQTWVLLHRWAGLSIALFLVIAGLTGTILPFEEELTFLSRPALAHVRSPRVDAVPLDGIEIARHVERSLGVRVRWIPLEVSGERVSRLFVTAPPGKPPLPFDVVWANPYSGAVVLTYRWGGVHDGIVNIVPLLYSLHYGIIAGDWGKWAFGVAGLLWTLDCFVGFYLTLPVVRERTRPAGSGRNWWSRWSCAWRVRQGARGIRLNFDIHRAVGLWVWPLLFAFAWSGVGLLLPAVEHPVMRALGASEEYAPPALERSLTEPALDFHQAVESGVIAMQRLLAANDRTDVRPEGISYDPASGTYQLQARTSLDLDARTGNTAIWIDGRTGVPVHFQPPYGVTAADAARQLFLQLHFAAILGLPYRIFVSAFGLMVVTLTITGIVIWMKKREARWLGKSRVQSARWLRDQEL